MPTNETGTPPVDMADQGDDPPDTGTPVHEVAAALFRSPRLCTLGDAAITLNYTPDAVRDLITAGSLDAVSIAGHIRIPTAQVTALAERRFFDQNQRDTVHRTLAHAALTGFLATVEATGDWTTARDSSRPLVCARRGTTWSTWGIECHNVAVSCTWVIEWAMEAIAERPEFAGLAIGTSGRATMLSLAGVEEASYVTAFDGGHSRRVAGWARLDPAVWPVRLPALLEARVNGTASAEAW